MHQIASHLRKIGLVLSLLTSLALAPSLVAETTFTIPPGRAPLPITTTQGPDQNVWFVESFGQKVGKITPTGVITEYPIPGSQSLIGIATGPDGNMWFTDQLTGMIGRIAVDGTGLTRFTLPTLNSHPQGIAEGPDGNMWFVDEIQSGALVGGGFKIGKISMTGQVTEYSSGINAGTFQEFGNYASIIDGPDGNLWFTNPQLAQVGRNIVGRVTTAGVVSIFSTGDTPLSITSGDDGNLWVTENAHVAKVTLQGVETEYALTGSGYTGITPGPDGNIWFTETTTIGYVTRAGVVTEFPSSNYFPSLFYLTGITTGGDGFLWAIGDISGNIGRVDTSGSLTNTYQLTNGSQPTWDALGSDGNVWTTQLYADSVSRVTPTGAITTFPVTQGSWPGGIAAGSDGNLFFVEDGSFKIGKMTPSGNLLAEYPTGRGLFSIIAGPDGNLWFGESNLHDNSVVKMTTNGAQTAYPIPTPAAIPLFVTVGPDGNIWFIENGTSKIGKVVPSSGQITEYSPFGTNARNLGALVAGPDGNLWVQEATTYGAVAKISTSGALLAEYAVQMQNYPNGFIVGSDGAMWFGQGYPNSMARITTSGVVSTVPLVSPNAVVNALVTGADGKLWTAQPGSGGVGRMSAIGGTGNTFQANHGSQFNGAVASFVDGTPTAHAGDFAATIIWGDGSRGAGTVSGPAGGPFIVSGTHTYSAQGSYSTSVTLSDSVDDASYKASSGIAQVH